MSDGPMSPDLFPGPGPGWQALGVIVTALVGAGTIVSAFVIRLWTRLNDMDKGHNDFRVEVARNYVTVDALIQVEQRLVAAINRMTDRLERALDRQTRHHEN
jgi:hypothetical protein